MHKVVRYSPSFNFNNLGKEMKALAHSEHRNIRKSEIKWSLILNPLNAGLLHLVQGEKMNNVNQIGLPPQQKIVVLE